MLDSVNNNNTNNSACESVFSPQTYLFHPFRETNSGLRGVWVYEIGTNPYFSNVAPGEVTDLPTEATPHDASDGNEESTDARRPVYGNGQHLEYPHHDPEAGQIHVHPVQYQPDDAEVVVVEQPDINVDGTSLYFDIR